MQPLGFRENYSVAKQLDSNQASGYICEIRPPCCSEMIGSLVLTGLFWLWVLTYNLLHTCHMQKSIDYFIGLKVCNKVFKSFQTFVEKQIGLENIRVLKIQF